MAHRQRRGIYVAVFAHIRNRALYQGPSNKIGTVEHNDFCPCLASSFEKVPDECFVGIKTNAGIGEIDHDCVEAA